MSKRPVPATKRSAAVSAAGRGRPPQSRDLRAAKDALYREHIMEAAERIFAEQGFADARMNDIARSVGISLGTLYQAYPGKTELYRAILIARDRDMLDNVLTRGQKVLQQPQTLLQLLWLTEIHLSYLLEHPDYLRMQLHDGHAWYHRTAWPSKDEQRMWERGLDVMKQVFIWGQAQRLFVAGDAADQARLMLALQQARLANWVSAGMKEPHPVVMARIQADFIRTFCRPAVAAELLSADGSGLNDDAKEKIRALGR